MKVWVHTSFTGHYPVGVSAVVVADTAAQAAHLLSLELAKRGLDQSIKSEDFLRVMTTHPHAFILQDGNY